MEQYLKDLPPELLPIEGSVAAKERKVLLRTQIPFHDIDPNLCHQLTDDEVMKMNDYILQVKEKSAGVGHLLQIKFDRATIKSDRVSSMLPNSQIVQLQGSSCTKTIKGSPSNVTIIDERSPNNLLMTTTNKLPNYAASILNRNEENMFPENHLQCKHGSSFITLDHENNKTKHKDEDVNNYEVQEDNLQQNSEDNCQTTGKKPLSYCTEKHLNLQNYDEIERLKLQNNLPNYLQTNLNLEDVEMNPTLQRNVRNKEALMSTIQPLNARNPDNLHEMGNNMQNLDSGGERGSRASLPKVAPSNVSVKDLNLEPMPIAVGSINDIIYDMNALKTDTIANVIEPELFNEQNSNTKIPECHRCHKMFNENEMAIGADRTSSLWHTNCFKCAGCNQSLADLLYFFDKETDNVYCLRDYAKIRGVPRCKACDELIFVKEYCLTVNETFHLKHFCCYECDIPLAGHNYVLDDDKLPICLPCYESLQADKCNTCKKVIKPNEQGASLMDTHFHANDECFSCKKCLKPLLGNKFLFKNQNLYCSGECYSMDQ